MEAQANSQVPSEFVEVCKDFDITFEFEPALTGGKRPTCDEKLFDVLKDTYQDQILKELKYTTKFPDMNEEYKEMRYENIYFQDIQNGVKKLKYALEIDQDFHKPSFPKTYLPANEILRESMYFDEKSPHRSDIIVRFGYKDDRDEPKTTFENVKKKVECFLNALINSSQEGSFIPSSEGDNLRIILENLHQKKGPLVIFVDYPDKNKHIEIHKQMDLQSKKLYLQYIKTDPGKVSEVEPDEFLDCSCEYCEHCEPNKLIELFYVTNTAFTHRLSQKCRLAERLELCIFSYKIEKAKNAARNENSRQLQDFQEKVKKYLLEQSRSLLVPKGKKEEVKSAIKEMIEILYEIEEEEM